MTRDFNADEADRRYEHQQKQQHIEHLRENVQDQQIVVADAAIDWLTARQLRGVDRETEAALANATSTLQDLQAELARAEQ